MGMRNFLLLLFVLCAGVVQAAVGAKPAGVTFQKSAIWLAANPAPVQAGDTVTLKMHYRLDPSETWGDKPTQLVCMPLGPWIDNPDGQINKKRQHIGYPGLGTQAHPVAPGEGVVTFSWKLRKAFRYNACFFLCKFKGPDGKDWPWEWRGGRLDIASDPGVFALEPTALGGLFTYGETPQLQLAWGQTPPVDASTAQVTVKDLDGATVWQRKVVLAAGAATQTFALDGFAARGTFSATVELAGVGTNTCFFGLIPPRDASAGTTPFGVTNMADADYIRLARKLGFSHTRLFETWKSLQPAPDVWCLDELDRKIKLNNEQGLRPWICLYDAPAWALPPGTGRVGYEPAPFDLDAWRTILDTLARRYQQQVLGFEMLNEIVPGNKCKDPVKTYVDICRVGSQAVKAVDPKLSVLLAGGLWPHNYRIDLLNAGIGQWIDVLPVHYSTFEGVVEARTDLAARGLDRVRVTDDETASGLSTWNLPPELMLAKSVDQCRHVMTRWPDELCAGAKSITYFGGMGDPCGNWSYLIDRKTPRPCAVTLGVVQSFLADAKPVGKFVLGGATVHLFERRGQALAFVSAPAGRTTVTLPAKGALRVTDFQGRQTQVADGRLTVGDMPVIVEGGDLAALKRLAAAAAIGKVGAQMQGDPRALGNLVQNGDFEDGLAKWGGRQACAPAPDGTGAALALKGTGRGQWKSVWQSVDIPVPGQTYLYTCWMRGEGQGGGSNLSENFSDGTKSKMYTMPSVFVMGGAGSAGWRLMVKRFATHANTKSLTLTPVADGTGRTWVDNVSLSLDAGTDFVAFAARKGGASRPSPIPLCCDNQIKAADGYRWQPKNLSGVVTFAWDDAGLALHAEVEDDVSAPQAIVSAAGDEALKGDVLVLSIFPKGTDEGLVASDQLRWYLSLANPGGGSGRSTLCRPARYAGGLPFGQLAKDSSAYDVNFRREGTRTVYDLVIPWRELPGLKPGAGVRFGCNLVLVDADEGPARGTMVWGAGLGETSAGCGLVTLVP